MGAGCQNVEMRGGEEEAGTRPRLRLDDRSGHEPMHLPDGWLPGMRQRWNRWAGIFHAWRRERRIDDRLPAATHRTLLHNLHTTTFLLHDFSTVSERCGVDRFWRLVRRGGELPQNRVLSGSPSTVLFSIRAACATHGTWHSWLRWRDGTHEVACADC